MDSVRLQAYEARLLGMRAEIEALEATRHGSGATVELDQTRTGRLSRMDALQVQAMAQAGQARAQAELQRINAALRRVADGTFGECIDCGEFIPPARLEANPAATLCVTCAAAREQR